MNAKDRKRLMKEWLKAVLDTIREQKEFKGIVPSYAMAVEVKEKMREDLNEALMQMVQDGEVRMGKSINDTWIELEKGGK